MAVYDFGVDTEQAWRLTIPDIHALTKKMVENERRENYRAAMIVAAIYNVNRDPKKRNKPFTPEEILGEKKKTNMRETAKMLTELHGGEVRE